MDNKRSASPERSRDGAQPNDAKRRKRADLTINRNAKSAYRNGGSAHPFNVTTWNCNGFSSRTRYNRDLLDKLVRCNHPSDVICIQEARLKADGTERGRPWKNGPDYEHVQAALKETLLRTYTPFWSLADKKYAGTLTLVRTHLLKSYGTSADKNNCFQGRYDPDFVAFTPSSAINLMLRRHGLTREECELEEEEKKTTMPQKKTQQTSLKSFFAPKKKKGATLQVLYKHEHTPEGRFQFFFFPGMDLVQTYVPNNGTKDESFERRRAWDVLMLKFVRQRNKILQALARKQQEGTIHKNKNVAKPKYKPSTPFEDTSVYSDPDRKLCWCGDMNVAATYKDGSHWERRPQDDKTSAEASGDKGGEIYEWFRDEAKCLGRFEQGGPPKLPENVGIPGFTLAERQRFATFLEEGNFCDVWRRLLPDGESPSENESSPWERANFTWRGHLGKNGGFAKYQGKGQRIDYFLLSPKDKFEEVFRCRIFGHGTNRENFWGSDHCGMGLMFKYDRNG